jgi:hypothetical protein
MYLSSHIAGLMAAVKYLLGLSPPPPPPNSNLRKLEGITLVDPSDPSKDEVLFSPLEGLTLEDPKTPIK